MRISNSKKNSGFTLVEFVVSLSILALLAAATAYALAQHHAAVDRVLLRHQALAAAEAQLERIRRGGAPLTDKGFTQVYPRLSCEITQSPGKGDWAGLQRYQLTVSDANADTKPRKLKVSLVGYCANGGRSP